MLACDQRKKSGFEASSGAVIGHRGRRLGESGLTGRAIKGFEESDQIRTFTIIQVQGLEHQLLMVVQLNRPFERRIELDHILQSVEPTFVHVGRRTGDFTQRRRSEPSPVLRGLDQGADQTRTR